MRSRTVTILAVASLLALGLAACSSDDSSGSSTTTGDGGGVTVTTAAGTATVAVEAGDTAGLDGPMTLSAVPDSVPAGPVEFDFDNTGTIEHEMVVLKTDTPIDGLEVDSEGKVSEADSVGEVSETPAGETGTVTLDLEPGNYLLVCNIAEHYGLGMRTAFTVTS